MKDIFMRQGRCLKVYSMWGWTINPSWSKIIKIRDTWNHFKNTLKNTFKDPVGLHPKLESKSFVTQEISKGHRQTGDFPIIQGVLYQSMYFPGCLLSTALIREAHPVLCFTRVYLHVNWALNSLLFITSFLSRHSVCGHVFACVVCHTPPAVFMWCFLLISHTL